MHIKEVLQQEDWNKVREQLLPIRRALMYSYSNRPGKLLNDVVHVEHINENGEIWIKIACPHYNPAFIEAAFPVKLCLFQKSIELYLEAEGMAYYMGLIPGEKEMLLFKTEPSSILITQKNTYTAYTLKNWLQGIYEKIKRLLNAGKKTAYSSAEKQLTNYHLPPAESQF